MYNSVMKTCSKCLAEKELTEFHRNPDGADGYASRCKDCFRVWRKTYLSSDVGKAVKAAYLASDSGVAAIRKGRRKYDKTEKGKASRLRYATSENRKRDTRNDRARHPDKIRARMLVRQQVKRGRWLPAASLLCAECGHQAAEYHHHNGYSFEHRLDVIPLCSKCHSLAHPEKFATEFRP